MWGASSFSKIFSSAQLFSPKKTNGLSTSVSTPVFSDYPLVPDEIFLEMLLSLDFKSLLAANQVSKRWHEIITTETSISALQFLNENMTSQVDFYLQQPNKKSVEELLALYNKTISLYKFSKNPLSYSSWDYLDDIDLASRYAHDRILKQLFEKHPKFTRKHAVAWGGWVSIALAIEDKNPLIFNIHIENWKKHASSDELKYLVNVKYTLENTKRYRHLRNEDTLLHIAVSAGALNFIPTLLALGGNIATTNIDGKTPLTLAANNKEIFDLLFTSIPESEKTNLAKFSRDYNVPLANLRNMKSTAENSNNNNNNEDYQSSETDEIIKKSCSEDGIIENVEIIEEFANSNETTPEEITKDGKDFEIARLQQIISDRDLLIAQQAQMIAELQQQLQSLQPDVTEAPIFRK